MVSQEKFPLTGPLDSFERRSHIVAYVGYCSSAACLFFVALNLYWGDSLLDSFMLIELAASFILLLCGFFARRYLFGSGLITLAIVYGLGVYFALTTGRAQGVHLVLLMMGPIAPLFLGGRSATATMMLAGVGAAGFVGVEYTMPMIVHEGPWLSQIRNPITESLEIDYNDVVFVAMVAVFSFVLSSATLLGFRSSERAEEALQREHARSELLLRNLLPQAIAIRLKDSADGLLADRFDCVTILFADIVDFTPKSQQRTPEELVGFLDRIFGEFDRLTEKHGLEKIKTVGDAYMVAGGMPELRSGHPLAVAQMALDMIATAERLTVESGENVSLRIGVHCGPAVAGVIGRRKPFYDVWGHTINVAARMESSSVSGRIQITPEVKALLGAQFTFEDRGMIDVKGVGPMQSYFLVGRSSTESG